MSFNRKRFVGEVTVRENKKKYYKKKQNKKHNVLFVCLFFVCQSKLSLLLLCRWFSTLFLEEKPTRCCHIHQGTKTNKYHFISFFLFIRLMMVVVMMMMMMDDED
jgi:nitric oxide reductase large subunit